MISEFFLILSVVFFRTKRGPQLHLELKLVRCNRQLSEATLEKLWYSKEQSVTKMMGWEMRASLQIHRKNMA
jgi:hypothetical protein